MNVKEGDIARVVGLPLNQMALLRIIRALLPGEDSDVYRPAWVCEALSPCHGDGSNAGKIGMPGDEILAYDGCLRPLYMTATHKTKCCALSAYPTSQRRSLLIC